MDYWLTCIMIQRRHCCSLSQNTVGQSLIGGTCTLSCDNFFCIIPNAAHLYLGVAQLDKETIVRRRPTPENACGNSIQWCPISRSTLYLYLRLHGVTFLRQTLLAMTVPSWATQYMQVWPLEFCAKSPQCIHSKLELVRCYVCIMTLIEWYAIWMTYMPKLCFYDVTFMCTFL
jgi:hypothetical protein